MQQLKGIIRVGQVLLAVAFLFAIVGCSSNDITGPQSSTNNGNMSGVASKATDNSVYTFKYQGQVAKVDPDLRVIQFVGNDFATTSLQVEIARDAEMILMPGDQAIPFDFKFVTPGSFLSVYGEARRNDKALISLAQVSIGAGSIDANPNVVAKSSSSDPQSTFKYNGQVAKSDVDQRVIQFVGSDFSAGNLTVEISRDAQMQIGPGGQSIPFDFKFINVGTYITVRGQSRADGSALVDNVEINGGVTSISASPSI